MTTAKLVKFQFHQMIILTFSFHICRLLYVKITFMPWSNADIWSDRKPVYDLR